jgi:cysteine desulfurase
MTDATPHELAYLDFCATTPVEPETAEVVMQHMINDFGNSGSRTHQMGNNAKKAVENARREVAGALGFDPPEIVFTSGATEANNLAILGLADYGRRVGRTHIVTTQIEHKSVLEPCRYLEENGFSVTWVPPANDGAVRVEDVLGAVQDDTLLVTVMHANNETGVLQPIEKLVEALPSQGVLVHVDAAQSFGKLLDWSCLSRADLVSISGHKIGAPKGVGALAVNRERQIHRYLKPLHYGGGQELGLRPGTVSVPLVAGLGVAARRRAEQGAAEYLKCSELKLHLLDALRQSGFEAIGDTINSLPNCVCINVGPIDAEAVFVAVRDSHCISNGSACTSSSRARSHVLTAMGVAADMIDCSIRVSWGRDTSVSELDSLVARISELN